MALFRRRKARTEAGAAVSDRLASRADLDQLRDFASSRTGVEAFVEPQTSVTQTTLLLVAADGEWTRRRVESPASAAALARKLGIPCYDTNRVGYPRRMREYNVRRAQSASAGSTSVPARRYSPQELAAIMTLESIASVDPLPDDPDRDALIRLWKRARSMAHPDRRNGDRGQWDQVEKSAHTLGLDSD